MNNIPSSILNYRGGGYAFAFNRVREICQEVVLSGLWRSNFFDSMAFHGGTSLRIIHGLNRFSEDLDFCQISKKYPDMDAATQSVEKEFQSLGLDFQMIPRKKRSENISGYYVEGNTSKTMNTFGLPDSISKAVDVNAKIRIKIDIDTDTPDGFGLKHDFRTTPFNYGITTLDKPSMFAAKTSAVISRHWKNRMKGRDLFDFEWYINNNTPLNTVYLINNLLREGKVSSSDVSNDELLTIMEERFDSIDYDSAMLDLYPFVDLDKIPDNWSPDHFIDLSKKIIFV